ncbi:MAG: hypothetical protein LBS50_02010 [Prevotellaceae bacterium]|jgi:hypothetical protein|nr:hypothetical protein [Prevotellaceae bacterium]
MNKTTSYFVAFLACIAIFALWVIVQVVFDLAVSESLAGHIVGAITLSVIVFVWKLITNLGRKNENMKKNSNFA